MPQLGESQNDVINYNSESEASSVALFIESLVLKKTTAYKLILAVTLPLSGKVELKDSVTLTHHVTLQQ